MKIFWTPTAIASLKEIYDYIKQDSKISALKIQEAIKEKTISLSDFPELGTKHSNNTRKLHLAKYPYYIIYRVETDKIVILRIRHSKRLPF